MLVAPAKITPAVIALSVLGQGEIDDRLLGRCSGFNGIDDANPLPTIAGQHKDYIERALHDYQKGGRKNPIMAGMAATLSKEDIAELAEYYSSKTPSLEVLPKKHFFFSADTSPKK